MAKKGSPPDEELIGASRIANLLGLLLVKDEPEESEKIALLDSAGFGQAEIAKLLRKNPVTIRTTLHRLRKKRG